MVFYPYDLRCEHVSNPDVIDTPVPRFSWKICSDSKNTRQRAYRITVTECSVDSCHTVWDSRSVESDNNLCVVYGGQPLKEATRYAWTVQIQNQEGQWSPASERASFLMGLFNEHSWTGGWIGFAGGANGCGMLVRRSFLLKDKPAQALVFYSGLGYGELHVNGQTVGDRRLDPAVSDYSKRVYYAAADLTDFLSAGKNVIGMMLGNGWYGAPKCILELRVVYPDGTKETISTARDTGWQISRGPITENSIYDGETFDARLEKPGWDTADYLFSRDDRVKGGWIHAMAMDPPGGKLLAQALPPIREHEMIPLPLSQGSRSILDVGKNIAGVARIRVRGSRGSLIRLRFAELLYPDGTVNQENLRTAQATDVYILSGRGEETYCPHFTYHGFRYIQVEVEGDAEVLQIEAVHLYSDVAIKGTFSCSDPLICAIEDMIVRTEQNNLHGIPTDCPQRDERMGWLNDATVRAEESVYHFDMIALYEKWLWDIEDTQDENGAIADTAPFRFGMRPADPVCSSFLIIPWLLYLHYGDDTAIRQHYQAMKRWTMFLKSISEDFIVSWSRFGEWASPKSESQDTAFGSGAVSATTPGAYISTGYFYVDAVLMCRFAERMNREEDRLFFSTLAENIKSALQKHFFHPESAFFAMGSQAANAFALHFGLVPEGYEEKVLQSLIREVERHKGHLSTGNQGTKYLMEALTARRHGALAKKILTQETYPGWGYMIRNGATTIWERWENAFGKEMNSHDHPMHGAVGAWFFNSLAGIHPVWNQPGFRLIRIAPWIPEDLPLLCTKIVTPNGLLHFSWEKNKKGLALDIIVPANTSAQLELPCPPGAPIMEEGLPLVPGQNGVLAVSMDNVCRITLGSGEYNLFVPGYAG